MDPRIESAVSLTRKVSCPLRLPSRTSRPTLRIGDVLRQAGGHWSWTGRIAAIGVLLQLMLMGTAAKLLAASHYETELQFFEGKYE
jgi:hypothetical protein